MIFPLLRRIECYKRSLVTRLCHKKMFTSGTEILKKAENVSMICNAPDNHRLQLMAKTSTKSINNSRTYWHGWNFIWISAHNFEGSFERKKSQNVKQCQTRKASSMSFENQGDVDSFLRLSWCCALRIPSNWPNCKQGILFKRYASLAWSYSQKVTGIIGQQLLDFALR